MTCQPYEKELAYLKGWARAKGFDEFYLSLDLAVRWHEGQERKGGGDYVAHPVRVTKHAVDLGFHDEEALAGYMLHDVMEDCNVTEEMLYASGLSYGTVETVYALTKQEGECDADYYNRFYHYYHSNVGCDIGRPQAFRNMLGKFLDRCNNVSTMAGTFTQKRAKEYVAETHQYVMPLLKFAIDKYPEHSNMLYLVKYHIESVCNVFEKIDVGA